MMRPSVLISVLVACALAGVCALLLQSAEPVIEPERMERARAQVASP